MPKFEQTALTSCDSYKISHADQYPAGTTKVYSNFTPRSLTHLNVPAEYKPTKVVWFGIQIFLNDLVDMWDRTFFSQPKDAVIAEFIEIVGPFCGPNGFNGQRLAELHDLGYLPLHIKALPEGSLVPTGVPVLTITNTVPEAYWLPNFLETWMSADMWKSSTSATISLAYRRIIDKYSELTGGSKEFVMWQGHDFSSRGMSGIADAARSGAGHLLSFAGTDNITAVKLIRDVYKGTETFIGGSVPATEHSVMAAGGKESEIETFRRLIRTYPSGVLSVVSDTWDFWNVITVMANELKEDIVNRVPDSLGLAKLVFRPDSGDPVDIICGNMSADPTTPEYKGAVECLWDTFGGSTNEKGFRTLNPRVGLIYGDSITTERAARILQRLADKGFASDNVVFGIGSYTFQYTTRDTLGFAMKATYVEINGAGMEIFKDPKTDSGTKKSAKGLLKVVDQDGTLILIDCVTAEEEQTGLLRTVFLDGKLTVTESFADIRARLGVM